MDPSRIEVPVQNNAINRVSEEAEGEDDENKINSQDKCNQAAPGIYILPPDRYDNPQLLNLDEYIDLRQSKRTS